MSASSHPPPPAMLRPSVGQGEAIKLVHDQVTNIGRGAFGPHDVPTAADDTSASREHARLYYEQGRWVIEDNSRNGTFVNGELIKGRPVPLKLGDRIQIGRSFDYTFSDLSPTVETRVDSPGQRTAPVEASAEEAPSPEGIWISPSAAVWRDGVALEAGLSRTEYRLIRYLASRPGQVCDYDSVVKAVWGDTKSKASLHELIFRVRRKIEEDAALPKYLIIRSGIGVVFFPKGETERSAEEG